MKRHVGQRENSDIRKPLLQEESSSASIDKLTSEGDRKKLGTPKELEHSHSRFCDAVTAAWNLILDIVKRVFCRVAAILVVIYPFKPKALTAKQEEKLRELWYRSQISFDSSEPEHLEALKELWHAAFPDAPWSGQRSNKWSEMGWQGMDPATDFRGGGYLSLICLLDLRRMDPILFHKLMNKTEGKRSEWEYPFAIAGVNITYSLTEMLHLRDSKAGPSKAHVRGFVHLLEVEDKAFSQLFCLMFALLDKTWLEMEASYMEFPQVMRKTRRRVEEALGQQPRNADELRRLLAV